MVRDGGADVRIYRSTNIGSSRIRQFGKCQRQWGWMAEFGRTKKADVFERPWIVVTHQTPQPFPFGTHFLSASIVPIGAILQGGFKPTSLTVSSESNAISACPKLRSSRWSHFHSTLRRIRGVYWFSKAALPRRVFGKATDERLRLNQLTI
jgi:hypothetical protein